jgi:glycerophosphoryl diester phosphodiesterase
MRNFDMKITENDRKVMIYAHRGASGIAPENTMASFRKAVGLGADGIELDVQLTADGRMVVVHDERLGRTCAGSGMIRDLKLEYLRSLDFGGWFSDKFKGEKIPLLEEVIEMTKTTGTLLNIEMKTVPCEQDHAIEYTLAKIISATGIADRAIVSSFDHYSLEKIKNICGGIRIAPLYVGMFKDICAYALKLRADFIHPQFGYIDADTLEDCRKHGIGVNVWTVDGDDDIKRMAEMGVSGIVTNKPDKAVTLLGERSLKETI